ncbi:MAG: tRNA pseudouridine(55) synthase TruB [Acidobacteria bacterium]|nr:tRNA pseudouridine(55) synthase TruB [Acidobacteriota bacterium]
MDGLLSIDKPAGRTSHDVVARARRLLREKRVGHTGTLDPFATGVLVLLVGRATRLAQFLSGAEKEYEATVRLGFATDTGDLTGERRGETEGFAEAWGRERIEPALQPLRGEIGQVPPMYSAKKVQGRKLYELARRGVEVEREPVRVTIRELEFAGGGGGDAPRLNEDGTQDVRVRVVCSAGTYVRTLAESIGETLGVGAHLSALRRTRAGTFRVADAVTLERLAELAEAGRAREILVAMNAALPAMPQTHLTAADARRVLHGMAVAAPADAPERWVDGARVRLLGGGGELFAVGVYDASRASIRPRVMLAGPEGGAE